MSSSPEALLRSAPVRQVELDGVVLRGAAAVDVRPFSMVDDLRPAAARRKLTDPVLQEELAAARAAAEAQGFAAGWAAGQQAARAAAEVELQELRAQIAAAAARQAGAVERALAAVAAAAGSLERRVAPVAAECHEALTATAVDVAEALLGRELTLIADPVMDAVRRALDLAPQGRPVVLRLNPADHASLLAGAAAETTLDDTGRELTLVADPGVEPGGCVAECDATRIDAQLGSALERVREALAS